MNGINVITITREYDSGGEDIGRQLADVLGWTLLDREIVHAAAALEHVPELELERCDEQPVSLISRVLPHPHHEKYLQGLRDVVRAYAAKGNVIFIGRGARFLLGYAPNVLHLSFVAPLGWRAARAMLREGLSYADAVNLARQNDSSRERFLRYFFGADAARPWQYDLVVNTCRVSFETVVAAIAAIVRRQWPAHGPEPSPAHRILTVSRELGAADDAFVTSLARQLAMDVFDRSLLEQEAVQLGMTTAELEMIDETPGGLLDWFIPGTPHHRYVSALRDLMAELATRANALIVGRGANGFLCRHHEAFHVRLIAIRDFRMLELMRGALMDEARALRAIAESDTRRSQFYKEVFAADWADPLEYNMTVNTGRLGSIAADLIAFAGNRHWSHGRPAPLLQVG